MTILTQVFQECAVNVFDKKIMSILKVKSVFKK